MSFKLRVNFKGLCLFDHDDVHPHKQMKVLGEATLGSAGYATPVAANGTLFVCSQSYLWAVQQGAKLVTAK